MNKSAVFWFEFFSKRFGPGPSSVTKYVGNASMFTYVVKEKKPLWCSRSARGLEDTEVGVQAAWMTGAKPKNKAHLQALPLHVFSAEHNSAR